MLKRLFILSIFIFLSSCSHGQWFWEEESKEPTICPLINMRDTSYAKFVQHLDSYQIMLVGYNGSCFMDPMGRNSRAIIQPVFVIRRQKAVDTVDVPFKFYTETTYGPADFVGRRTYNQIATIPEFQKEIHYTGQKVEVKLPEILKNGYAVNLGLVIDPAEQIYNNRTFDNTFNYSEEKYPNVFAQ